MDTSADTLRKWEDGRSPIVTAYPKIIEFLGCEPWDGPTTLAEQIRAARYRSGLRIEDAAKLLGVNPTTFWWWEAGRTPHRVVDRSAIADFVSTTESDLSPCVIVAEVEEPPDPTDDIGSMLRRRRQELGLTINAAAKVVGANSWTLLHWEHNRHAPACRFYPSIIRFLGCEPWPQPGTIADLLRAERLRRGLSCVQVAALLQVDDGSINSWEAGDGPHQALAKAKVEAFLSGLVRPWQRRRPPQ